MQKSQTAGARSPSYAEESWMKYPMGFPRYAAFVAFDEDKSTTIYRRFDRLASRDLLNKESELAELESKQDKLDEDIPEDLSNELEAALAIPGDVQRHASYDWEEDYIAFKLKAEHGDWESDLAGYQEQTRSRFSSFRSSPSRFSPRP